MSRISSTRWLLQPAAPEGLSEKLGVPPVIAQVFYHRGIQDALTLDTFLSNDRSSLHDPFLMAGMGAAVERIRKAVESDEKVAVFGDFDVDGVTATAILVKTLEILGAAVIPYIPHRVRDGHGLNEAAIRSLSSQSISLIVTVDCGITSQAEVTLANSLGMQVIVTDHHKMPLNPPEAYTIVSPVPSEGYPFRQLTGAGVAFKLAQALLSKIGQAPDEFLFQMAALGTVGDVAPVLGENRILVKEGLEALHKYPSAGISELCRAAGIESYAVDTETISFALAPRLNASGRLDDANTSYRLLSAHTREEAAPLADELEMLNRERQSLTEAATSTAREEILAQDTTPPLLFVAHKEFNPGVNGLVASKLVEEFYRPSIIASLGKIAIASARSIPEFDIAGAIAQCGDLLLRHGGHPRAAGFTADIDKLPAVKQRLLDIAGDRLSGVDLRPRILVDVDMPIAALDGKVIRWLSRLQPYGEGNALPIFLSRHVDVVHVFPQGGNGRHLHLVLKSGNVVWDAVVFNCAETGFPHASRLDLVYTLGSNNRQGQRTLSIHILDAVVSE